MKVILDIVEYALVEDATMPARELPQVVVFFLLGHFIPSQVRECRRKLDNQMSNSLFLRFQRRFFVCLNLPRQMLECPSWFRKKQQPPLLDRECIDRRHSRSTSTKDRPRWSEVCMRREQTQRKRVDCDSPHSSAHTDNDGRTPTRIDCMLCSARSDRVLCSCMCDIDELDSSSSRLPRMIRIGM